MFIKIQTSEKSNGNKGSSVQLVKYLEKEDLAKEKEALNSNELPEERAGFFSQNRDKIRADKVISKIDNNKKALGKNDSKFYSITISPSAKEQQFLLSSITGKKSVKDVGNLTKSERQSFENKLKDYSKDVMQEYAKNFKREGLNDASQLIYFGKVEHERNYKGTDKDVRIGEAKTGQLKPGLNSHVHIIVSRKDKDHKFKLSPLANEKAGKSNSKLNGRLVTRGFDRVEFKKISEKLFDEKFNYKRNINEKVTEMMKNKNHDLTHNNDLLRTPKDMEKLYSGISKNPKESNNPKVVRFRSFAKRCDRLNEIARNKQKHEQKFEKSTDKLPNHDKALEQLIKEEKSRIKNLDFEI